jgi:cell division protein FtsB
MISAQIERLHQDSSSLEAFIKTLREEGNDERADKIVKKQKYLDSRIAEIELT